MTAQPLESDFLKSAPGQEPILVEGLFRATPARVFQAFTVPEEINGWFLPAGRLADVEIDLKVGGSWRFVLQDDHERQERLEGEYLEIAVPNLLKFSWRHVVELADGTRQETDRSFVSISFKAAGSATQVRLRHEAIKTEDARLGVGTGWADCLHRMTGFLAK
ncbi:SRPBCC family protein [Roseibium sp.]|uniref:SRPBCC family protein n=1 Tax=Roseibium sp. TaxID=1936156 RepID=UPI003B51FE84